MNDRFEHRPKFAGLLLLIAMGFAPGVASTAWAQDDTAEQAESEDTENPDAEAQVDGEAVDPEAVDGAEEQSADAAPSLRRGNRMEFDARLIRGEAAGSGAVFLFQRAQRPLPSMIDKRTSFLRDTVDSLLGGRWTEKFDQAQTQNADTD